MFHIGPYSIPQRTVLAPMAGVTDLPFRKLCRQMGAGLVVSEMVSSDASLRGSRKSQQRLQFTDEPAPRSVQIVGYDPQMMAEAARYNVAQGAEIIDINMGCPAKKVCRKAAGSALLQDPALVARILEAVVGAVDIPVTLKIRTGWDEENRNAALIGRIAEDSGIAALSIHGRTRACRFNGQAEYRTIADVVAQLSIPVIANGDIDSAEKAAAVLQQTGAAAVMIGRAAQGNPWLFREINHYLASGEQLPPPDRNEVREVMLDHLHALHNFYGEVMGPRIARKHIGWYLQHSDSQNGFVQHFNKREQSEQKVAALDQFFNHPNTLQYEAA